MLVYLLNCVSFRVIANYPHKRIRNGPLTMAQAFDFSDGALNVLCDLVEYYLSRATWEQLNSRSWYFQEHTDAVLHYANVFNVPITMSGGIIAAYSVNTSWTSNKTFAGRVLDSRKPYGLPVVVKYATRILGGENPADVFSTAFKLFPFYDNLTFPDLSDLVTVDRWIIRLLLPMFDSKAIDRVCDADGGTPRQYIQAAIALVALAYGYRPHELQAILWHIARGKAD